MRIISLVPSVTETLFELGLEEQIVAITRWCTRPREFVSKKPKVGGTKNPRLDSIAAFHPDVVIMDRDENRKEDADALEKLGIYTFPVFPKTIEDSMKLILDLGKFFSVEEKALRMNNEMQNLLQTYRPSRSSSALVLIWRSPFMTFNADTYANAATALFGFQNVFATHEERYPKLTDDEINHSNPEVLLFPDEPYPFQQKHIERFKLEFHELSAVKKNQILLFDGTFITWHGFGTLRALREFPSILSNQLT